MITSLERGEPDELLRLYRRQRSPWLYTGSTDNLARRIYEHREKIRGFTARYDVTKLVWFQAFEARENAFRRERQIKE